MTLKKPGRLERVGLREVWLSEASDFKPWLGRNVNLVILGGTLGIDLELETQERPVGPFRADILCKATARFSLAAQAADLAHDAREPETAHTFLHDGQNFGIPPGLGIDHLVGMQARAGQRRREQVAGAPCAGSRRRRSTTRAARGEYRGRGSFARVGEGGKS